MKRRDLPPIELVLFILFVSLVVVGAIVQSYGR